MTSSKRKSFKQVPFRQNLGADYSAPCPSVHWKPDVPGPMARAVCGDERLRLLLKSNATCAAKTRGFYEDVVETKLLRQEIRQEWCKMATRRFAKK